MTSSCGALRETAETGEVDVMHDESPENSSSSTEGLAPLKDDHHAASVDIENEDDDDDDDDEDDENADLKSIHRFKTKSNSQRGAVQAGSMRRVDSLERFITRSERLAILGKDPPPPPEEVAKRRVQFRPEDDLETVFVLKLPPDALSTTWMSLLYMTEADFDRIDADMKLTHFRWENHLNGKIRFNESESTLRGLEFMNPKEQLIKEQQKLQHRQRVLQEAFLQKTRAQHHWETLRKVSLEISEQSLAAAQDRARRDHFDYCKAWGEANCNRGDDDATPDEMSLDKSFGINAGEDARRRDKQEQQKQQQRRHQHQIHARKTRPQRQDKPQKKNPLFFWQK